MTKLLPVSATAQEQALEQSTARIGQVPNPLANVWNPHTCPLPVLAYLAWALSVDEWDPLWTEAQKRAAVAESVEIHRRKGTFGAVRRAVNALGYEVTINEQTGEPYTFSLQVNLHQQPIDAPDYAAIEAAALRTKNARSKLLGIQALMDTTATASLHALHVSGEDGAVFPFLPDALTTEGLRLVAAEQSIDTCAILPDQPESLTVTGALLTVGGAYFETQTISL